MGKLKTTLLQGKLAFILLFLLLGSFYFAPAQSDNPKLPTALELGTKLFKNQPHQAIQFILENKEGYKGTFELFFILDMLQTLYSQVGLSQKALEVERERNRMFAFSGDCDYQPLEQIRKWSETYKEWDLTPVLEHIDTIAENHSVFFINEAHHVAEHRAFVLSILQRLYDKGYRYLACETLIYDDMKRLNNEGFPLMGKTGFYTNEPMYGELVRQAIKLGYKVVAYEATTPQHYNDTLVTQKQSREARREEIQARNLIRRASVTDTSKMLVYAGYGHILKNNASQKMMAQWYAELTGYKTVSVDQSSIRSTGEAVTDKGLFGQAGEHLYYFFNSQKRIETPSLIYYAGKVGRRIDKWDYGIFHPEETYRLGRPQWLWNQGDRKAFEVNLGRFSLKNFPVLVSAYYANEPLEAVPADQIMVFDKNSPVYLALLNGNYNIVIRNSKGKYIRKKAAEIK